jgi:hypothetical protein
MSKERTCADCKHYDDFEEPDGDDLGGCLWADVWIHASNKACNKFEEKDND